MASDKESSDTSAREGVEHDTSKGGSAVTRPTSWNKIARRESSQNFIFWLLFVLAYSNSNITRTNEGIQMTYVVIGLSHRLGQQRIEA